MTPLVEAALAYAARGWPVFPCHALDEAGRCTCSRGDCRSPGKHPRTANGVLDATTREHVIERMFGTWPDSNLAIATGPAGLVVVDLDVRDGVDGRETLARLEDEHGRLPRTVEQLTGGGGAQIFFAANGRKISSRTDVLPGVDTRGLGGYVLVPPSKTRREYAWNVEAHPDDTELAEVPRWLEEILTGRGRGEASRAEGDPQSGAGSAWIVERPPNGQRHGRLRDLVLHWRNHHPQEETRSLAHVVARCWGMLADRQQEVENLVVGAYARPAVESRTQYERERAVPPAAALPAVDLAAEPGPVPEPLVGDDKQQLVMPGEIILAASDPGVGKTKTLSDIALAVASGGPCLGFPTRQRPVVYVTSDGDPDLVRNVRRQWVGRGREVADLADLPLHLYVDPDFCAEEPTCYARLVATLDKVAGGSTSAPLLIVESLSTNVRGTDLNDQVQVRGFVRRSLRSLQARHPGLAILVSAHLRKPQAGGANELGARVAGSMQIRGALDCVIGLVPAGRDAFTVRRVKRSRSGADFASFRVRITGDRSGPLALVNEGPMETPIEVLRGAARAVLDYLQQAGPGPKPLTVIAETLGRPPHRLTKRTVERACRKLAEADPPCLIRTGTKPAAYLLQPPKQEALDLDGLD